jgi:hypothetical protein
MSGSVQTGVDWQQRNFGRIWCSLKEQGLFSLKSKQNAKKYKYYDKESMRQFQYNQLWMLAMTRNKLLKIEVNKF